MKNTFSRLVFVAFAVFQQRFCCAKPSTNSQIRKFSLHESPGDYDEETTEQRELFPRSVVQYAHESGMDDSRMVITFMSFLL